MTAPIFIRDARQYDSVALLREWRWLVPERDAPVFLSAFGDWVTRARDGSLWILRTLEGDYQRAAKDGAEFNRLNKDPRWCGEMLLADWWPLALDSGLAPAGDQCIGWKIHPVVGGPLEVANLQLFAMSVYQTLMAQLHRQVQR